ESGPFSDTRAERSAECRRASSMESIFSRVLRRSMKPFQEASISGRPAPTSTDQSASICVRLQKAHQRSLRPAAVVAVFRLFQKGAVAAALGLYKGNVRIGGQGFTRFRKQTDKWVV